MKKILRRMFVSRPIAAYIALGAIALNIAILVFYFRYALYPEPYIYISVNGWIVTLLSMALVFNGVLFIFPNEFIAFAASILPALALGLLIIDPLIVGSFLDEAMRITILGNAFLVPQILMIVILFSINIIAAVLCVVFCWQTVAKKLVATDNNKEMT